MFLNKSLPPRHIFEITSSASHLRRMGKAVEQRDALPAESGSWDAGGAAESAAAAEAVDGREGEDLDGGATIPQGKLST